MIPKNIFREARPASGVWNLSKSLVQMVVFWTLFLAVLPALIYLAETLLGGERWRFASPNCRAAGATLFALASTLGVSSCLVMALVGRGTPLPLDCPRQIVVVGPYRYLRNPMAVAGLSQGVAVGLFVGSPAIVLYALAGGPAWHLLVRPAEERDLAARFGDSYRRYAAEVRCWIPRFPGYSAHAPSRTEE